VTVTQVTISNLILQAENQMYVLEKNSDLV
jgi:hypothetical protein